MILFEWGKGFGIEAPDCPGMRVYLWFYEWNLFNAVHPEQHCGGIHKWPRTLDAAKGCGKIDGSFFDLTATAKPDGAELALDVTNNSEHDWPETAAIIPCFNAGNNQYEDPEGAAPENPQLRDDDQEKTYFIGSDGPENLVARAIHFNKDYRGQIETWAEDGVYAFSKKWPTSDRDAAAGMIIRESLDGEWVCAIAWEDFISAQGHNPWKCMHLSVRVGALKRGESKTIRGRMCLFQGKKEDCYAKFQSEFGG